MGWVAGQPVADHLTLLLYREVAFSALWEAFQGRIPADLYCVSNRLLVSLSSRSQRLLKLGVNGHSKIVDDRFNRGSAYATHEFDPTYSFRSLVVLEHFVKMDRSIEIQEPDQILAQFHEYTEAFGLYLL